MSCSRPATSTLRPVDTRRGIQQLPDGRLALIRWVGSVGMKREAEAAKLLDLALCHCKEV
eukprot:763971-Hanusia_phi.AAC.3